MRIACLVVVLLACACKEKQEAKPAPAPTPPPAPIVKKEEPPVNTEPTKPVIKPAGGINTNEEYVQKALDLTDGLIKVFEVSGRNCDKLANNIETFIETNKDALAATDQFEHVNPSAEDDLEPKLQSRAKLLIEKAGFALKACDKHAGFQAAMAKLPD